MSWTKNDIYLNFQDGNTGEYSHMLVAFDDFDRENYPIYVPVGLDPRSFRPDNGDAVDECYSYQLSWESQAVERRAQHWDYTPKSEAELEATAPGETPQSAASLEVPDYFDEPVSYGDIIEASTAPKSSLGISEEEAEILTESFEADRFPEPDAEGTLEPELETADELQAQREEIAAAAALLVARESALLAEGWDRGATAMRLFQIGEARAFAHGETEPGDEPVNPYRAPAEPDEAEGVADSATAKDIPLVEIVAPEPVLWSGWKAARNARG